MTKSQPQVVRVYELDEFICNSLLAMHMALHEQRLAKSTGAINAYLLRRINEQLAQANGSLIMRAELTGMMNKAAECKRLYPRSPEKWLDLHAKFEAKNLRHCEARARFASMPATDILCIEAVRVQLEDGGFHCRFGVDIDGVQEQQDRMIIILREHIESCFDDRGALKGPCSVFVCGNTQPIVDAFYSFGFLMFQREQARVDGILSSHLVLDPLRPLTEAMQPSKKILSLM